VISVVCVYNNKTILEDCLLKSLHVQTTEYESILVDNTEGRFKSASKALNFGAGNAKGKYVMFVHQDVDLCSNSWFNSEKWDKLFPRDPYYSPHLSQRYCDYRIALPWLGDLES